MTMKCIGFLEKPDMIILFLDDNSLKIFIKEPIKLNIFTFIIQQFPLFEFLSEANLNLIDLSILHSDLIERLKKYENKKHI